MGLPSDVVTVSVVLRFCGLVAYGLVVVSPLTGAVPVPPPSAAAPSTEH
jgi:hypothetical protein